MKKNKRERKEKSNGRKEREMNGESEKMGRKGKRKTDTACGGLLNFCLGSGSQCGDNLDPRRHLEMPGDIF